MTQEQVAQLLQNYLDGKASTQEIKLVEDWYGKLNLAEGIPASRKVIIAEQIQANIHTAMRAGQKSHFSFVHRPMFKMAATLLVICTLGLLFWLTQNRTPNSSTLLAFTKAGERKALTLADGSVITLEPLTRIAYPQSFNTKNRSINLLAGEAFFSIAHEEKRSFTVLLKSGMVVKVLGTSFRIRDVAGEKHLKVTVATGKVAVNNYTRHFATLTRGQEFQLDKHTGKALITKATHPNVVPLVFNGSTMQEVIKKMEYVYNISIVLKDPEVLKLKCTASFNSGQTPSEILDILCRLHHLRFNSTPDHKTFKIYTAMNR